MFEDFKPTNYLLESVKTGVEFEDKGWTLEAPGEEGSTLVRAVYEKKQIDIKDSSYGIYRFSDWLPVCRMANGSAAPVTYKSEGLAKYLGLNNLYITFSGYWPEKGALMRTCSFKETEAYSVVGRMKAGRDGVLVVASAGNTARAFAGVCSENNIPLLLCVPEDNLDALWLDAPLNPCVKLIVTRSGSDYFDAIHLSNLACEVDGFFAEGGAKNVARRDGMGTTMLSAAHHIGSIPEYYFQAIGSGTGAIAAWEANMRLLADGRFGTNTAKLMVSQNKPFTPIYDSWKANSRQMLPLDENVARKQVEIIDAKVLSNRKPPYSLAGGLFDALKQTGGDVLLASNEDGANAARLFEELEGCDIHPAAAIAAASLISEAKAGRIPKDAVVMLNITGGGEKRYLCDKKPHYIKPNHVFDINPSKDEVEEVLLKLFE